MRNKIYIVVGVITVFFLGLMACEKHQWDSPKWDYDVNESPNPVRPRPIVYDTHVAPLFENNGCTSTSCHDVIPPKLTPSESESALSSYINASDPENSVVVLQIIDPAHGGTWNYLDLFTLLDWISLQQ